MADLYPPSEKRLAELRQSDIFPRSKILESTFALVGAATGSWVTGASLVERIKQMSTSAFQLSVDAGTIDYRQVRSLIISVLFILLAGAAARLLVIKAESRILLKYPSLDVGRIFRVGANVVSFFNDVKRGILLSAVVASIGLFLLIAILPHLLVQIIDWKQWTFVHLLVGAVVMALFGILELFRSVVTFGNRYGMTREELIAEQQELRPEFKSEIQRRFNDGD